MKNTYNDRIPLEGDRRDEALEKLTGRLALAVVLRQKIRALGVNQKTIVLKSGLPQGDVSLLFVGKGVPTTDELEKLSGALGTTCSGLRAEVEAMKTNPEFVRQMAQRILKIDSMTKERDDRSGRLAESERTPWRHAA